MSGEKAMEEQVITALGGQGKACMVTPTLAEFQSLWPTCGRQRTMAETLDQKRKRQGISVAFSNASGRPFLRGKRDERKTWSTLHLLSAEQAGSSQQGDTCMRTEAQYDPMDGGNGLCRRLFVAVPTRGISGGNTRETNTVWGEVSERSL